VIEKKELCPFCKSVSKRRIHKENNKIGMDKIIEEWFICRKCNQMVLYQKPEYLRRRVLYGNI